MKIFTQPFKKAGLILGIFILSLSAAPSLLLADNNPPSPTDTQNSPTLPGLPYFQYVKISNCSINPNPFSPDITNENQPKASINFSINKNANVQINVLKNNNIIKNLNFLSLAAGNNNVLWNGANNNGTQVSSGTYSVKVTATTVNSLSTCSINLTVN